MSKSDSLRERAIRHLTANLQRRGGSHFQMLCIATVSILTGVLASLLFHSAGMSSTVVRYPLCVGVAYLSFLLLLSSFVSYHRSKHRQSRVNSGGTYDTDFSGIPQPISLGGGQSAEPTSGSSGGGGSGFHIGGVDGDGIVVIFLILFAFGSTILATIFVVYQAPLILAEILVDGVLFYGLARRVDRLRPHSWVAGVVYRTALPLIAVTICYAVVGLSLECLVPGATTMNQAFQMTHAR